MNLSLPANGARVLVHTPSARVAETVHALADQGAAVTVHVAPGALRPVLRDLASRDLVTLDPDPDYAAYDVVLRDPAALDAAALETAALEPGTPEPRAPRTQAHSGPRTPTATPSADRPGRVILVGGGPGDPGLLTLAGWEAVQRADVVVCDRLAPVGLLASLDPAVTVIHVGKIPRGEFTPQEDINALLVTHAAAGSTVVRLKGGDSFVFGRGGEEWNACVEAGIPVTVIPGVSSSLAAPALAGIPVTHRQLTQGFIVVSGHVSPQDPRSDVNWAALAGAGLTIVILMGVATLAATADALITHGLDPQTPAACIANAGLPAQRSVRAPLIGLAEAVATADLQPPSVCVVGPVVDALALSPS